MLREKDWIEVLENLGALWVHDKNPQRPHALLTSGKHSNGFFNMTKLMQWPQTLSLTCRDLGRLAHETILDCDWIVGSAMGAITMAHEIAQIYNKKFAFTEPVIGGPTKHMALHRFEIPTGSRVLMVEDVMTTGGTTRLSIQALEKKGLEIAPEILVLVNRSGLAHLDEKWPIISLIDEYMPIWQAEDCPLCQEGSIALRPKQSWKELNANYPLPVD